MMCSPAGSQRIMWWFSGRSRRLGGQRAVERERKREREEDVRVELCEKCSLGL